MRLNHLTTKHLELLQDELDKNIDAGFYSSPSVWVPSFFNCDNWFAESQIVIPEYPSLLKNGEPKDDLESSMAVYNTFRNRITPVQATESRIWTYLCHVVFWEYMTKRWPPDKRDIQARYFVSGKDSRSLTRNGIARLWWFAHLTYDESRANPYELTGILLSNQNIQHNFLERSFGRNHSVLHALLDFIKNHPDKLAQHGDLKAAVEDLGKLINRLGGVRLLDCLSKKEIADYLLVNY